LASRGESVLAVDRADVDITDAHAVERAVANVDVVVNCAAFTAVDAAEAQEAQAFAINAAGAANLARAAHLVGARIAQVSTDYVFDGVAEEPYAANATLAPRSAYGRTKAAGEWAVRAENPDHLIVRTAWLYGAQGPCFPKTIARVARERGGLEVVSDQVGQPTWTLDLAELILRMVDARVPAGIYHGTASGETSWYGFARAIVLAADLDPAIVEETTSADSDRPAPRPAYSVLAHDSLRAVGIEPIGSWRERWETAAPSVLA
jgi:dTDP-4-dehydrorhamnose reductase